MKRTLLVAIAVCLVGCGDQSTSKKVQLRYMAWGNPEQMALEEEFCQEFNRQNPDIEVKFFRVPGSAYLNKAIVMFASRTSPDVVRIDHFNFASLAKKDYFLNMNPLAEADADFHKDDFYPQAIREGMVGSQLQGMNVMFGATIVYYNKNLLKKNGLQDPYKLWEEGKWTWEKYREYAIATTVRDESGRPKVFGTQIAGWPLYVGTIWGFGGDIFDKQGNPTFNDPKTVAGYQFLADLRWKDKVCPTPAQGANSAFTFESGKLAMIVDWMGNTPRFRKVIKDFEWDTVPIPSGIGGAVPPVKGNQLIIYRESKHPKEAWRFVRFMTGPWVEERLYCQRKRNFPTRRAQANSDAYLKSTEPPFNTASMVKAVEIGRELPITDRWGEVSTIHTMEIDNLWSGRERNAKVVLDEIQRKVIKMLGEEEGF